MKANRIPSQSSPPIFSNFSPPSGTTSTHPTYPLIIPSASGTHSSTNGKAYASPSLRRCSTARPPLLPPLALFRLEHHFHNPTRLHPHHHHRHQPRQPVHTRRLTPGVQPNHVLEHAQHHRAAWAAVVHLGHACRHHFRARDHVSDIWFEVV